jgi:hypothetical protein
MDLYDRSSYRTQTVTFVAFREARLNLDTVHGPKAAGVAFRPHHVAPIPQCRGLP